MWYYQQDCIFIVLVGCTKIYGIKSYGQKLFKPPTESQRILETTEHVFTGGIPIKILIACNVLLEPFLKNISKLFHFRN
jgi:hypothetical protein